jgi:hypothetical protein
MMIRMFRNIGWIIALVVLAAPLAAQSSSSEPDECFGFSFGAWDPPLKSVANHWNPGEDPTAASSQGAPRAWAARAPNGREPGDSTLILFPSWWPSGVSVEWTSNRGDTLVGIAHALVADGRLRVPSTSVRGLRVPCRR